MENNARKSEPPVEERIDPWMHVASQKRRLGVVDASSAEVDSLEPAAEKDNGFGGPMCEGRVPATTIMSRGVQHSFGNPNWNKGSRGMGKDDVERHMLRDVGEDENDLI
ncbi:hypothetical protein V6N13_072880 [Hibiscus sabdariffa]|uniref:Uncharacterized protein n=1 Tax=Hibiscus sabdariffa TaxID=183260 RepID=A0ABR2E7G0_9ROSI